MSGSGLVTGLRRLAIGRRRASLGTGPLWLASIGIVALRMVYDATRALAAGPGQESFGVVLVAWGVLVIAIAAVITATRALGEHLPGWMLAIFSLAVVVAIALDLAAHWGAPDLPNRLTVAITAATSLVLIATTRSDWEVVGLAVAVAIGTTVATVVSSGGAVPGAAGIWVLAQMAVPGIVFVSVVSSFRGFVQVELDRSIVQGTVAAPRLAVGMLASERLARLDLDAEELLSAVADGRLSLPLPPEQAEHAAELATQLRLNLLEGSKQTWLYHATTESGRLGRAVTVIDPDSIAGLLDSGQRDGLLSALWLLLDPRADRAGQRSVTVRIGPVQPLPETTRLTVVPIVITTTGLNRTRVDAAVWGELARVGQHWDSVDGGSLRVDIRCATAHWPVA